MCVGDPFPAHQRDFVDDGVLAGYDAADMTAVDTYCLVPAVNISDDVHRSSGHAVLVDSCCCTLNSEYGMKLGIQAIE